MKIHFFIEDTHLPQRFPNASAVSWSLVLQTRNLANKFEEFQKCDDFSGEISQLTDKYMHDETLHAACFIKNWRWRAWFQI
jgi:hypothetical protein